jgi:hypothetical protein
MAYHTNSERTIININGSLINSKNEDHTFAASRGLSTGMVAYPMSQSKTNLHIHLSCWLGELLDGKPGFLVARKETETFYPCHPIDIEFVIQTYKYL